MQKDPKSKKIMVMVAVVILHVALLSIIWIFSGEDTEDPEKKDPNKNQEKVDDNGEKKGPDGNQEDNDPDDEPEIVEYVVKKGDLLSVIAYRLKKKYELEKISTNEFQKNIMEANNITNPNRIRIGHKLKIPIKE